MFDVGAGPVDVDSPTKLWKTGRLKRGANGVTVAVDVEAPELSWKRGLLKFAAKGSAVVVNVDALLERDILKLGVKEGYVELKVLMRLTPWLKSDLGLFKLCLPLWWRSDETVWNVFGKVVVRGVWMLIGGVAVGVKSA